MGPLELQKAYKIEARRLLWLVGLVFATIVLLQRGELPKSVFSQDEIPGPRNNNATSNPILIDNSSSPNVNSSYSTLGIINARNTSSVLEYPSKDAIAKSNSSFVKTQKENILFPPGQNGNSTSAVNVPPVSPPPIVSNPIATKAVNNSFSNNGLLSPASVRVPGQKHKQKQVMPLDGLSDVVTFSEMKELLVRNKQNPDTMVPRWSTKTDGDLVFVKSEIEKAPISNHDDLYGPLYNNASMFMRSYELMEKMLKIYIYKEGDRRIFHFPPLKGIYASEGWFMKLLESNKQFVTKRPKEAHLFYLPFSSRMLEEVLYVPNSHSHKNLIQHLKSYVDLISGKYPFWNRTDGTDHFLVACHDWAPSETRRHMANTIRALCNADVKEGFKFGKDVSLPETYVSNVRAPLKDIGGKPASKRKILAFFAGSMHGYLRPILVQHWNKDPDMRVMEKLSHSKGKENYVDYMKSSKYCLCPRGYEVNSPRVVEAIFYECVPVIISDNFVPPFFETLNWETFAVFVMEKDIPNLKNILLSIPEKTYFRMYMRVKKVQRHFLWHPNPVKFDLFHMILHSVWYTRIMQFRPL